MFQSRAAWHTASARDAAMWQVIAQFIFNRFLTIILFTNKFVIITNNMITLAGRMPHSGLVQASLPDVIKMNALKMSIHETSISFTIRTMESTFNHNTCNVEKWSTIAMACDAHAHARPYTIMSANRLRHLTWLVDGVDAPCIGCSKWMC